MADSPFETAATVIMQVFDNEFDPEGFKMIPDKLHEALGRNRVAAGIAPVEDVTSSDNANVQETFIEVRLYDLWTDEIDPETQVNPFRITAFAERLRNALRVTKATDVGTGDVWFFDVRRTQYPDDPTGNKSRFHMTIRAFGNNATLVETTA